MDELVSIITPSYNTAKFIKETIESVRAQTYKNWEMIIVDDCSNDDSTSIIKSLIDTFNDHRIKLFINERNSGAALSRNRALRLSKGRWIAFLDSDDLWEPEKLEKQIKFMENNKYYFSYTNYIEIDEESKAMGLEVTGPKKVTKHNIYNYCWMGCLTVMYDSNKIGLIQIKDLKKNNDYALWLKVSEKANCYLLNDNLARYRKRNGSISNHSYVKLTKWHYRLFRVGENKGVIAASVLTVRNLVFGVFKKLRYVKKV